MKIILNHKIAVPNNELTVPHSQNIGFGLRQNESEEAKKHSLQGKEAKCLGNWTNIYRRKSYLFGSAMLRVLLPGFLRSKWQDQAKAELVSYLIYGYILFLGAITQLIKQKTGGEKCMWKEEIPLGLVFHLITSFKSPRSLSLLHWWLLGM